MAMKRKEKIRNGKLYTCKSSWNTLPITKDIENAYSLFIIESIIGQIIPGHMFVILEHRNHTRNSVICKVLSEDGIIGWSVFDKKELTLVNHPQ
jgi:hypothetical protein